MSISIKPLSATEWDASRGDVDFHVRLDGKDYVIDSFRTDINDADQAHLTSFSGDSWRDVEAYLRDFNPETRLPEENYGSRHGHGIARRRR